MQQCGLFSKRFISFGQFEIYLALDIAELVLLIILEKIFFLKTNVHAR